MARVVSFKVKMEHWNKRNANMEEMYQICLVINLMGLWPVVLHSQMQGYFYQQGWSSFTKVVVVVVVVVVVFLG